MVKNKVHGVGSLGTIIGITLLAILLLAGGGSAATSIISVSTSPPDLTPQPTGGGTYYRGETATVIAQYIEGYAFQRWIEFAAESIITNKEVSTSAYYTFTVEYSRDLVAEYTHIPYTITLSTSPLGLSPQPEGGGTYYYGDTATVIAPSVTGYTFRGWLGYTGDPEFPVLSTISTSSSFSFKVTGSRNLIAEYSLSQHEISVSTLPAGLAQPTGGGIYPYGNTITVVAQTVTGYNFKGWIENGTQVSDSPIYSFTVTRNRTLMARYSQNQYDISISISPSGLYPEPTGRGTYYYGDTATVTAQPVTGYSFKGWTENGTQVSGSTSYAFKVTGDRTLVAEYSPFPYTISLSTSPSGLDPEPAGGGTYYYGDSITVQAQQVTGYQFQRWTENENPISSSASYTFEVTENRNLVAEYSKEAEPSIAIEPGSGASGREITVIGTNFNIFAEKVPRVSIYFDNRIVKEGVMMEKDESGTLGSFSTTFIVPSNIESGHYMILVEGPKNSVSADFDVEEPFIWQAVIAVFSTITAVVVLKYVYLKYVKPPEVEIGKRLPIEIETRGGIESTQEPEFWQINVEARGGLETL
ncbi:MAG TPA: InlB B-repeat-containing protein [Candidatus Methanoperedens sp.]